MQIYVIVETVRTDVDTTVTIFPKCYDELEMAQIAMIKAKNDKLAEWKQYWQINHLCVHIAEFGDGVSAAIEDSQDRAEWEIHTVELTK